MKVLVDNGHGEETAGKRSPDGRFREYAYTRRIAAAVVEGLKAFGHDAELLVPEIHDVSLQERARRVNSECQRLGKSNVLLVSIHVNAAGCGEWKTARGWSCYTSIGQTESDTIAEYLYKAAERNFAGHRIRTEKVDGDKDIEQGFYLLRKTLCPAVLVENFFMDNRDDLAFLESSEGMSSIIRTHIEGLDNYIKSTR